MGSVSVISTAARRLEGKVALITGGASGSGSSAAKLFCQHGAKVMIADIQDELGHSICKDLGPTHASFIHSDVTNEMDVQNAIDNSLAKHGKLDVMFNNAGIIGTRKLSILDSDKIEFENVLGVNVIGTFLGTKHAARVMIPVRRGSIINTASVSSIIGAATPHSYTSSNHAVLGLTRNTAVELGRFGIRVNCVSPSAVPTSMAKKFFDLQDDDPLDDIYSNLKGVALKPEDVAQAVLYLASDESKYVSGHNLIVDGGYSIFNQAISLFNE
ncbi:hypothetical protein F0562_022315 [Nyssa sinensis]|uniref:Secoisolariciresinol dehydrogenase n=1 Tax=Nyssa sinensis TaxID=561372 RepID=A0A5J5BMC4_9ASTE|nr:hypothetical protein F0562_022315 [Nyssa sinensis]